MVTASGRTAVIACGAIARDLTAIADRQGLPLDVFALPPILHNHPARIAAAVESAADELLAHGAASTTTRTGISTNPNTSATTRTGISTVASAPRATNTGISSLESTPSTPEPRWQSDGGERTAYDRIVVGYADCGTYGALDELCSRRGWARLPGLHCYDLYAGPSAIARLLDEEPGTYFLTDFLVLAFDRLVIRELGLDRYPDLRDTYFGHYTRVIWLTADPDGDLRPAAQSAAARLGLPLHPRMSGGELDRAFAAALD